MEQELTPEKLIEMGKKWGDLYLRSLPPEERLKGLGPEERLKGLSAEEIEAYLRKLKKNN